MRHTWRLPVLVLLPALLVLGLVVQTRSDDGAASELRLNELTPTASAPGTLSSTWYCAAGTATGVTSGEGAGVAEQTVVITNASDTDATGTLTVMPSEGEPTQVPVTVAAHSRQQVAVTDHVKAPWASALVEVSGGEVTVAHSLSGPAGRSLSNCAATPGSHWYLPSGTTRPGAQMWIALFNPFPGEATVDLSFDSDEGTRSPQNYQGLVVPGGRVVVEEIGKDVITGQSQVSTTVSTRSGRIVAEMVQAGDGRQEETETGTVATPAGLTATLGATTPAPLWTFPVGAPADDTTSEVVSIFNPGESDTDVTIQVQLDDPATNGTVEPFQLSVPAHRAAVVDVTGDERVPRGAPHWLVVRSAEGADIVASRSISGVGDDTGWSITMGLPVVGTRWLSAVAGTGDTASSMVAVTNPSATETATVTVRTFGDGATADVEGQVDVPLAPGQRLVVDLGTGPPDGSVEVTSDQPVVVAQWLAYDSADDWSTPLGVPVVGTQSLPVDVIGPQVADTGVDLGGDLPADDTLVPLDDGSSGGGTGTSVTTAG
jgi:hypothetical protein